MKTSLCVLLSSDDRRFPKGGGGGLVAAFSLHNQKSNSLRRKKSEKKGRKPQLDRKVKKARSKKTTPVGLEPTIFATGKQRLTIRPWCLLSPEDEVFQNCIVHIGLQNLSSEEHRNRLPELVTPHHCTTKLSLGSQPPIAQNLVLLIASAPSTLSRHPNCPSCWRHEHRDGPQRPPMSRDMYRNLGHTLK